MKVTSLSRALIASVAVFGAALVWSRDLRRKFVDWMRSPSGFFAFVTAFAILMSFGPDIRARDRIVLDTNVYAFFYHYVPRFDGLRVPARYGMIAVLGLAMLTALALGSLHRKSVSIVAGAIVLFESFAAPIAINQNSGDYQRPGLAPLLDLQRAPPAVYNFVATLPANSAIAELPLGEPAFDVRYMYYSTRHWRSLVNGYTGGLPARTSRSTSRCRTCSPDPSARGPPSASRARPM